MMSQLNQPLLHGQYKSCARIERFGVDDIVENISIDCLVYGLNKGRLEILLMQHGEGTHKKGYWGFPRGWMRENDDLDAAAYRLLHDLTGLESVYLEQLKAFGRGDRFSGKSIVTVAYYALVRPEQYHLVAGLAASEVKWVPISDCEKLIYDNTEILNYGLECLKSQVCNKPVSFNLLPDKFTLLQLQEVYEVILGVKLDKPNFRRKILKSGLLIPCNEKQKNVPHRAAALYRFDKEAAYKHLVI